MKEHRISRGKVEERSKRRLMINENDGCVGTKERERKGEGLEGKDAGSCLIREGENEGEREKARRREEVGEEKFCIGQLPN